MEKIRLRTPLACISQRFFNNSPSLTTGLNTERNSANDVMSTGDLFSNSDVPKQKKTKCEELSVLKTMQAIMKLACTAVLVKQLR